jgi:hypothetical protein
MMGTAIAFVLGLAAYKAWPWLLNHVVYPVAGHVAAGAASGATAHATRAAGHAVTQVKNSAGAPWGALIWGAVVLGVAAMVIRAWASR